MCYCLLRRLRSILACVYNIHHALSIPLICILMLSHKRGHKKGSYRTFLPSLNPPRTCDYLNRKYKAELRSALAEGRTLVVVQRRMKRFQIHTGLIQIQHKSRPLWNGRLWLSGLDCLFKLAQEAFVFPSSIVESPQWPGASLYDDVMISSLLKSLYTLAFKIKCKKIQKFIPDKFQYKKM